MSTFLLPEIMKLKGHHVKRSRGQVIQTHDENNSCSYIQAGYVKRYHISRQGNINVQSIYGPSDFFPLTHAFTVLLEQPIYQGDEQYYYEAMTDVRLYSISGRSLRESTDNDPRLYKEVLGHAGIRLKSNIQKLENIALKDAGNRVAHCLVYYSKRFGKQINNQIEFEVPLKQQDIADILNISRETVTRSMSSLRAKGLITTKDGIIVHDLNKLKLVYL